MESGHWTVAGDGIRRQGRKISELWIVLTSVVEPAPDFLAGAGAGEKAPARGCCYLARGTVVAK